MIDRRSRLRRFVEVELPIALIVAFALGPYVWMVLTSIKPEAEIGTFPPSYIPQEATLVHYETLAARTSFLGNLLNSLIVALGAVAVGLGVSVPAAYAFSRFRFRARNPLLVVLVVMNMVPVVLLIIPLFVLMRQLGLLEESGRGLTEPVGDLRHRGAQAFARAEIERHALPPPVVDLQPYRGERFGA